VRGLARQSLHQHLKHALDVRQYVIVPETQHAVALGLEVACACFVVILLIEVLASIQLHHQRPLAADEVDHVPIDFVLAAEFAAIQLAVPQAIPQHLLSVGHACTQPARAIHIHAFHP